MTHHILRQPLRILSIAAGVLAIGGAAILAQQPQSAAGPRPQTPPEALPSAKELVAKHIAAIGGEAAFKAITSVHAKGQFSLPAQGVNGDLEVLAARPSKFLLRVEIPGVGHVESGYDGKNGWSIDPMSGPTLLTGRALSEMAEDAWFDSPLHRPDRVKEMTTLARTDFDKRPAYSLKVVYNSGVEQTEYFDAETGLQLGLEGQRELPIGVLPMTTFLREYKKFGTLMQATVLLQRTMGFDQVSTLTSFEYNAVPATAFDPPPQVKALIK